MKWLAWYIHALKVKPYLKSSLYLTIVVRFNAATTLNLLNVIHEDKQSIFFNKFTQQTITYCSFQENDGERERNNIHMTLYVYDIWLCSVCVLFIFHAIDFDYNVTRNNILINK